MKITEQEGVRKVDFVDGVTGENEAMNERDKLKQDGDKAMKKSVEETAFEVMDEKKSDYQDAIDRFKAKGGKVKKVKGGTGKAGRDSISKFKKSFGRMKNREDELDAKDKAERERQQDEDMAYQMNKYVRTLATERYKNLWTEAAKEGEDPEPVKGKKTMTGEKQETVRLNPKEAEPSPGPRVGTYR